MCCLFDETMVVKCPWCEKLTGFHDIREDGTIECFHCGFEIDIDKNIV